MKTNGNDRIKEKLIKHMLSLSFLGSIVLWTLYVCIHDLFVSKDLFDVLEGISELKDWVRISFWGFFQVYPLILTVFNIMFLRSKSKDKLWKRKEKQIEFITLTLGPIVSFFLCYYMEITSSDWTETLINAEKHIPIWTGGLLTVIVLSMIGVVGYLYLSVTKVYRVPPLLSVSAIAAVYIGMGMCIFWIIHIFPLQELVISRFDIFRVWTFYLVLFPLNCLILGAKLIRSKVREWNENQPEEIRQFRISFLNQLNKKLKKRMTGRSQPFCLCGRFWDLSLSS